MKELLFLICLFAANTVQTVTGFAGSLLSVPAGMLLVGDTNAKVIVNIFILLSSLAVAVKDRKDINTKELFRIYLFMLTGMTVGALISGIVNGRLLKTAYGVLIVMISLAMIFIKRRRKLPESVMILSLVCAGIIHQLFISGGALLVIYASVKMQDKKEFRSTVSAVWVVLNSVIAVEFYFQSAYCVYNLKLLAASAAVLAASVQLGKLLFGKISKEMFFKAAYPLLILSGIAAIV